MATAIKAQATVISPSTAHTHTIVFLHGRGDNAAHFASSLAYSRDSQDRTLIAALPSFRWVFPQAPVRACASSPDVWPQWFDVWNVRDFAEREELQTEGLKEVVPAIRDLLAEEAARLGGRWDRVVLAGISMGAATSVHTLFNLEVPAERGDGGSSGGGLAAFLGFSCRCPFVGRSLQGMRDVLQLQNVPAHDRVLRNTPILLEHCADDPLVLVENGRRLRDTLQEFGAQVEWKEYPKGGHWFHSPKGMDEVVEFLAKHVLSRHSQEQVPSGQLQTSSNDAMDMT